MTRILADLPEDDIKWLDRLAVERGKSRAALVREAVATYRAQSEPSSDKSWLDQAFGIWKDRTDIGDAVEWAEFPDLFDEEDDRQRRIYLEMSGTADEARKRRDRK
jgi:hypothetical protein